MPARAIVFDVNETLLDMSALDPLFADAFSDKSARRAWFAQTLQNAMAATIVGSYEPFGDMAKAALEMTARIRGVTIDDERKRRILQGLTTLPAHGDAAPGLQRLREAGYRLAALTNSTQAVGEAQLEHAHLLPYFEIVLSAEAVRRFKPAPEVYTMAAQRLALPPHDLILVAAHGWDITGAIHAGLQGAFVARHGTALNPLEPAPTLVAPDLRTLADAIISRNASP